MIDDQDQDLAADIQALGLEVAATDSMMPDLENKARLARELVTEFCDRSAEVAA